MASLRVLNATQNRLEELPVSVSDMCKLQVFKVSGNRLRYHLRRFLEIKDSETSPLLPDKAKDLQRTADLKMYLGHHPPALSPADADAGSEIKYALS